VDGATVGWIVVVILLVLIIMLVIAAQMGLQYM
jgi:hypothetical protein